MDKRTLLAVVLSIAVILGYHLVFQQPTVKTDDTSVNATATKETKQQAPTGGLTVSPLTKPSPSSTSRGKSSTVETPLYKAHFSSRGASLTSFQLKKHSIGDNSEEYVEMVSTAADTHLPLAVSFVESSINMPQDVNFIASAEKIILTDSDTQGKQIIFTTTSKGIRVEKIYTFLPDSYAIVMELRVTNLATVTISQNPILFWYSNDNLNGKASAQERVGPAYSLVDDVKRPDADDFVSGKQDGPNIPWAAFESKYFIAAMIPSNPISSSVSLGKDLTSTTYVALFGGKMLAAPGQTATMKFSVFIGPKEYRALSSQDCGLERAINLGFFKWIAVPMLLFMKFIHGYVPNYGVGIIILAFLIKIIFWPLGTISYRSMKKMQDLQPKMKELQEKYKNDKQKLGQETMALYRTHKVNPMSGCLPIIVQIPVFIALFNMLENAIEMRYAPFFLWIKDLSAADPYYVTPILMGATMFIQQKMSPAPADPMQAKVMMFLPLVFTIFFLNFSSGLVLYWLISNVL
ncbi:MAG: membrane protein insertase YidC, partial [Deltaproteobacteria bacterium]|nr:membrane protein insertase YidC [Deltaproteobacteria bacterium]